MKVLFVSVSYMPAKMPSDKQFVRDLIRALPENVEPAIWTINDWPVGETEENLGGKQMAIHSRSRFLHKPRYTQEELSQGKWAYSRHQPHWSPKQSVELYTSFLHGLKSFRSAVRQHRPDVIHMTDNWGPVGGIIRKVARHAVITNAKMSSRVSQSLPYKIFLRGMAWGSDAVVCFTDACAEQFIAAGLPDDRLVRIPWGIPIAEEKDGQQDITEAIRRRYGCEDGDLLAVVSHQSIRSYKHVMDELRVLAENVPLRTVVAVKPGHWEPEYQQFATDRITVETGPADFEDLLWASDIMLSPTHERCQRGTATPPLTWMEAMARRAVLITTRGWGVEEIVPSDDVGFLYDDEAELPAIAERLRDKSRLIAMQSASRTHIENKYSIENIAQQYATMWEQLCRRT